MQLIHLCHMLDINECANSTSGCADVCVNLPGSFTCECYHGYQLINSTHCEGKQKRKVLSGMVRFMQHLHFFHPLYISTDINECLVLNGGCHQICTNTEGSFSCSCDDGFFLSTENNRTCEGE